MNVISAAYYVILFLSFIKYIKDKMIALILCFSNVTVRKKLR